MNINENLRNVRKNLRKIKGVAYKITTASSVTKLVPIKCLDLRADIEKYLRAILYNHEASNIRTISCSDSDFDETC